MVISRRSLSRRASAISAVLRNSPGIRKLSVTRPATGLRCRCASARPVRIVILWPDPTLVPAGGSVSASVISTTMPSAGARTARVIFGTHRTGTRSVWRSQTRSPSAKQPSGREIRVSRIVTPPASAMTGQPSLAIHSLSVVSSMIGLSCMMFGGDRFTHSGMAKIWFGKIRSGSSIAAALRRTISTYLIPSP